MVYDVIHVLVHHSHGRRMSHVFSHSNRKRNKCLLHLPGEARSFLWRTTQFVKSKQGATQAPSIRKPVPLKAQTFLYASAWWYLHTETAFFWNRYPEWTFWIWRVWLICVDDWNRILLKSLSHKPWSSLLNENFQVENGEQQCCRFSSPVLLHALKSILLFWRQQLAISNSLRLGNLLVREEGV